MTRRGRAKQINISKETAAKCDASNQFANFDALVGCVLAVPHAEIVKREQKYRREVEANPNRRGPKRKGDVSRVLPAEPLS